MSVPNYYSMEEIPNGSLNDCSPSSLMCKVPSTKTIPCCKNENFSKENENFTDPLTCRKALFNLPNGKNLLKYWDVDEEDKNDLFLTLVRTMSYQLVDLEEHMISDFIVVQKKINLNMSLCMIIDF